MRIMVTGCAGFLGSNLTARLLAENHQVIGLDNFQTGSKNNLIALLDNPNFELIEWDIVNKLDVDVDVEGIFNLACPASPPQYQVNPIQTFKTSVLGAMNLLEFAENKQARIFQASTSEIYGDPGVTPQSESYWGNVNTFGPRACYDEGKRAAETLFLISIIKGASIFE